MATSKERGEASLLENGPLIEICGTPFAARDKTILWNAIEDMVTERINLKFRGTFGISENGWGRGNFDTEMFLGGITSVRKTLESRSMKKGLVVGLDLTFAGMVMVKVAIQRNLISESEGERFIQTLLPYVGMQDLTIVSLVKPEAALTREFGTELFGKEVHEKIINEKRQFFQTYNDSARLIAANYWQESGKLILLDFPKVDMDPANILFQNANTVFQFLKLPTIEDWDNVLRERPDVKLREVHYDGLSGRTLAGLTSEELQKELNKWDWSKDPKKKTQLQMRNLVMLDVLIKMMRKKGLITSSKEPAFTNDIDEEGCLIPKFLGYMERPFDQKIWDYYIGGELPEELKEGQKVYIKYDGDPDANSWIYLTYAKEENGIPEVVYTYHLDWEKKNGLGEFVPEAMTRLETREITDYSNPFLTESVPVVEMVMKTWDVDRLWRRRGRDTYRVHIGTLRDWDDQSGRTRSFRRILEEREYLPQETKKMNEKARWIEKYRSFFLIENQEMVMYLNSEFKTESIGGGILRKAKTKMGESSKVFDQAPKEIGKATTVDF